jgi:aminoglycoside phosphotransferase family enzyme/predicted kinase
MMDGPVASRTPRIVETHISTLYFVGDRVAKQKKPIRTEFVDFTTVAARAAACRREVELNRRLAPDVYLGVADVSIGGDEVDHLVVMRRLPAERRLSARLHSAGADDDLRHIAHLLAAFHAQAARSAEVDRDSGHAAIRALWERGIDELSQLGRGVLDPADVEGMGTLALRYVAGRAILLDQRVAHGRACDGHGDLQAEDIFVLDDGPRILDCLEFDDRLRHGDVLADVAFLAMDLERLGRPDLATRFLDLYREDSADSWPESLAHLHIAYRAHVRCKVACLRAAQGDAGSTAVARSLHELALAHLEAARVQLVVVGGSPGTGKSTVSNELAERLGATVVSSDVVRDDLFPRGGDSSRADPVGAGRYRPELIDAVYQEVLRRAELLVERGVSVILDASWLDPRHRAEAADLAERTSSDLTQLRCRCPVEVAARRTRRRLSTGSDPSEATPEVAARLAADAAPWPEAVELDTSRSLGSAVGLAEAVVTRPVGRSRPEDAAATKMSM